jgi:diguanylate cyclase (GGDEF)-like protein
MRGMSGYRVLDALKARPEMVDVPVIFVTAHSEPEFEVSAFEAGAADFIAKPISAPLMLARVGTQLRVKRMTDQLRRAATMDGLTGVSNRRKFDDMLEYEWQRARRACDPMALLLIDIDHFKLYNDRYGHPKGDIALRQVARALTGVALRTGDLVARCGGEEFAILLPQTSRLGAEHMARRVLGAIQGLAIVHAGSVTSRHITVSIGISCYDAECAYWVDRSADFRFVGDDRRLPCTAADMVLTADKALYAAKRGGRAQARLQDIANIEPATPAGNSRPVSRGLQKAG